MEKKITIKYNFEIDSDLDKRFDEMLEGLGWESSGSGVALESGVRDLGYYKK